MSDWQLLRDAPQDGTEIEVQMVITARAFWCRDQKRFVLSRQFVCDYVTPSLWRPLRAHAASSPAPAERS